jgi:tetratricopeptide (TPR) repeat protein
MSHRLFAACLAGIATITAIAFAPALRGPQLFDDRQAIQDNATITSLQHVFTPPAATAVTGRPVVNLTLAFNYWLNNALGIDQRPDPDGPDKTVSYHVVNIALHIACGFLLIGIVRRTLRTPRIPARWSHNADIVALGVGALWLLHPLQTESVDYLIQRTELVVSFFYLATLYCSIRAWGATGSGWFVLGAFASLLGMASKEVMASAPIMIVLYDRAFLVTRWRELLAPTFRRRRTFYAALATTWLMLLGLMIVAPRGGSVGFHSGIAWYDYLHSQGWAIAHYLGLVIVPTHLSVDYDFRVVPHWRGVPGLILLTILAGLTIAAWTRANRWGWAAFLGSWFFLILAPSSSVVPILTEIVAERRMYLPLAAVIVVLAVAGEFVIRRMIPPASRLLALVGTRQLTITRAAVLIVVAAVILADGLTSHRSGLYRDPEAVWRDVLAKQPGDPRAWNNLGVLMANETTPQTAAADSFYREAVALDSSYVDALVNVGMSDLRLGHLDDAERRFRRVLALDSTNHFANGGLGSVLLGRHDTTTALPYMQRFSAGGAGTEYWATLGRIYLARGRINDGADALGHAVASAPERTDLKIYLAGVLVERGRPGEAEPYLEEALRRDRSSGVVLALLSLARADLGRKQEAVDDATAAVKEASGDERVYLYAGRAMLDDHRADLANTYLSRAVQLEPRDPDALTSLGEAESELGENAQAIGNFRRALQIDPADSAARARLSRLQ